MSYAMFIAKYNGRMYLDKKFEVVVSEMSAHPLHPLTIRRDWGLDDRGNIKAEHLLCLTGGRPFGLQCQI